MLVLGIESTCDETAISIVKDGSDILSNIIYSQIDLHKPYGGVFPELASRSHIDKIIPVINETLKVANVTLDDIDLIAVAHGPGLIGSLLIGVTVAKSLSMALNKPFIGVNHIEAHLYAAMMNRLFEVEFPALGVVISGGHTMLLKMNAIGEYEKIATTIDDAIGECFDKVASILDLPYPGGPEIEKLAKTGNHNYFNFAAGVVKENPLNFSFSGLKTKVLYIVKGQNAAKGATLAIKEEEKKHVAASFQYCAFNDLVNKTLLAAKKHNCKSILFGGGVSNNKYLRELIKQKDPNVKTFWPTPGLSLDNGAMIAGLGYHKFKEKNKSDSLYLEANPRLAIL